MRDAIRRLSLAATLLAVLTPVLAQGGGSTPELWVLNEGSRDINVILTASDAPDGSPISLGTRTPYDMCVATEPLVAGSRVYVTQEERLTVINAATRTVMHDFDLTAATGGTDIQLRGCAAAVPREFTDPASGLPVLRSHLFLAGTDSAGDAVYVVLDQALLDNPLADPVVDAGVLRSGSDGLGVATLDGPRGGDFQRAWFTVRTVSAVANDEIHGIELTTGDQAPGNGGFATGRVRSTLLAAAGAAPDRLDPGAARGREFVAMPTGPDGRLLNLELGGDCPVGADIDGAWIAGPGPQAYTVFALDRTSDTVHVVDPTGCGLDSRSTGDAPADIVTLGRLFWRRAYIANSGDDTLTRVDESGATSSIALPATSSGPIGLAVPHVPNCDPKNVMQQLADTDNDLLEDDILVTWESAGCPSSGVLSVWCSPTCDGGNVDCQCDCLVYPPPPGCACPGLGPQAFGGTDGPPDFPLLDEKECQIGKSGWKKLGSSGSNSYEHEDGADGDGQSYEVTQEEEPDG